MRSPYAHRATHVRRGSLVFSRSRVCRVRALGLVDKQNLVGIMAFREGWTDQLCVLSSAQGRGIGAAWLGVARSGLPRFGLWTFQRNTTACRFYEQHDFTLVRKTDGTANEKKEPDALYERPSGR